MTTSSGDSSERTVADWYRSVTLASPEPVNFLIAAPIFTVFSLIYLELVTRVAPRCKLDLRPGQPACPGIPPRRIFVTHKPLTADRTGSLSSIRRSRGRGPQRPLLLCRLHRLSRLPRPFAVLPRLRLRCGPRRRGPRLRGVCLLGCHPGAAGLGRVQRRAAVGPWLPRQVLVVAATCAAANTERDGVRGRSTPLTMHWTNTLNESTRKRAAGKRVGRTIGLGGNAVCTRFGDALAARDSSY